MKTTKVIGVASGLLALAVVLIIVLVSESENTSATKNTVDYTMLRAELAKVEKGDFVEFKSEWHEVKATNHISPGNERSLIMIRHHEALVSIAIYYNLEDPIAAQIGRIVRWNDPEYSIDHSNWTAAAREFFGIK